MITDAERKGRPRDLLWPLFAANVSVLGLSYGSFELGFGISFWQAAAAGLVGGVMGFDLIMRMQAVITVVTAVLTVMFIALVADKIHWHAVAAIPAGSGEEVIGALVFMMTGFGLGWVNAAADGSFGLARPGWRVGLACWAATRCRPDCATGRR